MVTKALPSSEGSSGFHSCSNGLPQLNPLRGVQWVQPATRVDLSAKPYPIRRRRIRRFAVATREEVGATNRRCLNECGATQRNRGALCPLCTKRECPNGRLSPYSLRNITCRVGQKLAVISAVPQTGPGRYKQQVTATNPSDAV